MEIETLQSCDLCGSDRIQTVDACCNLCSCRSCGYVFDNPRPTANEITAFYSKPTKYAPWIKEESARDSLWKRRLKKMSKTRRSGSLLDVGTGIGQFLHHARNFYSRVYGTEVSRSAIDVARRRYNLDIFNGDIESVALPDMQFDNITIFHVLEHVPSPRSVIERSRTLLRDGGVLVLAVPNDLLSIRNRLKVFLKRMGAKKYGHLGKLGLPRITLDGSLEEIHLSHFTPDVLQRLLEACGFRTLENGLDRYYVAVGLQKLKEDLYYAVCSLLKVLLRVNVYDTIWIAAAKN
jgi:2-polyprenyl-3-methyl-5-hydroxy-6-metoxy-1,4-benzoquinol methylase